MNETSILLAIIAILQGAYLVGQKNQRDDFKEMSVKLDHWVQAFIILSAEHDSNHLEPKKPILHKHTVKKEKP